MPSTTAAKSFSVAQAVDWVMTRINNIDIFDEHHAEERKTNPFYALGPIFYLVWFIVMGTGLVLIMWYIPTKAAAFASITDIQHDVPFGNIMRGMHKYGADAMIIAATMRLYRMFINADYKPGKEINIAIGLVTLLLSMYSGLTGYLLIWNQRAFWATKVFATFPTYMDQFVVMGDFYLPLVKSLHMGWNTAEVLLGGGAAITQNTITRFFSLHLAFSLIPLMFVELYFYQNAIPRMPINWIKRTVVIAMLVIVSIVLPAAQGHPSNPDVTPLPILSDWYFLGLYQMYKYLEPVVATYITLVIPLVVVALPFLDTWITGPEKDIMKRPFISMTTFMGFWCWVVFSILIIVNIANIHNDPPYWRCFLWIPTDIGCLWQMWLYLKVTDPVAKARCFTGAVIMTAFGAIQGFWAVVYDLMAKTDIFLDPLIHQWIYSTFRGAIQSPERLEDLVRKLAPTGAGAAQALNKEYWNFHCLLDPNYIAKIGHAKGEAEMQQLANMCDPSKAEGLATWADPLFKLIPTFEPHRILTSGIDMQVPHTQYLGFVDFAVNNRYVWDYCNFVDRMAGGKVPTIQVPGFPFYPLQCPPIDGYWMWASLIVVLAGVYTCINIKQAGQAKPAATAPQAAPAAR